MSERTAPLRAEDQRVVDLVNAALVDPNLHTDLRLQLHERIAELLEAPAK